MKINWKDKKTWIIIGVAALLIVVAVTLIRRRKNKEEEEAEEQKQEDNTVKSTAVEWNIKYNGLSYSTENHNYGWQVKVIQKALNDLHGYKLTVDGKYGPKTSLAVSTVYNKYASDGEISQADFAAMCDVFRELYEKKGVHYASNEELQESLKN